MASSQHREIQISQAAINASQNLICITHFSQNSSMFLSLSLSWLFIQYCLLLHPHSLSISQIYSIWECYLNSLLSPRIFPDKSNMGCYPTLTVINLWGKMSILCSPSQFYEVQYLLHTIYMLASFFTVASGTRLPFSFSGYSLLLSPPGHWTSHSTLSF